LTFGKRFDLTSGTRTIQYGYDDTNHSNNRLFAKRVINAQSPENNKGEMFSYDLADQVSAFQLNVLNPNRVFQPLSQTMLYVRRRRSAYDGSQRISTWEPGRMYQIGFTTAAN